MIYSEQINKTVTLFHTTLKIGKKT